MGQTTQTSAQPHRSLAGSRRLDAQSPTTGQPVRINLQSATPSPTQRPAKSITHKNGSGAFTPEPVILVPAAPPIQRSAAQFVNQAVLAAHAALSSPMSFSKWLAAQRQKAA